MKQKGLGHSLGLGVIEVYSGKIRLLEDLIQMSLILKEYFLKVGQF